MAAHSPIRKHQKMCLRSNSLVGIVIAAVIVFAPISAGAQSYPARPVTMVVPFAPGGAVDVSARLIAEPMGKLLGQQVIVDNRAGASGNIGYAVVARAPKDGYSVLVGYSSTHACNPVLYSNLTWDPQKDFMPIGMFAVSTLLITLNPSVPARTLPELIAYMKANPNKISYGSSGMGSLVHITGEIFQQKTGTKMVHVPYKGQGQVLTDLLSGQVQLTFGGPPTVMQYVQTGKLRAIATTSLTRLPSLPDVPTANESGVAGMEVEGWMGLFVPAGTPPQAVATLVDALKRSTERPDIQQRTRATGLEPGFLGPEGVVARVRREADECKTVVRNAGIRLE
jgi:tripartite-type tricarboxylate transporter receptor subunit TctC